jgi:chemotaxis methyl-accepting protein methylase
MRPPAPLLLSTRNALEQTYGLALEGLSDDQIEMAVYSAGSAGMADARDPSFIARVVDRLPIDESWLFRDDGLWEWLRDVAGPVLLDQTALTGRPVRVLSLGCSSGQEPFTAAMVFQDLLERIGLPPSATSAYVQVVGIDSSPIRVETARSGIVPAWSVQRCRDGWLRGRVTPEPGTVARYRIAPSVLAACRFELGNLLDVAARGNGALGGYDLVFCRHVLIYFRAAEALRIASDLARGLDPGAHLVFSAPEAHLVEAGDLEATAQLGVGRSRPRHAAKRPHARRPVRPRKTRAPAAAAPAPTPTPARPAAPVRPVAAAGAPDREAAVAAHVERALRLAQEGQPGDALREVRAALLHDPRHLYSRLLLGQHLIPVDEARGREVLRELIDAAAALRQDDAVPCAEGLSVGQLAQVARILLARRESV